MSESEVVAFREHPGPKDTRDQASKSAFEDFLSADLLPLCSIPL